MDRILVTATMSAGKSTLINALLGRKEAVTKNGACTSLVTEYCEKGRSLYDTPGVNNARNEEHKRVTRRAVRAGGYDRVIYVINATACGTEDDYEHMRYLRRYSGCREVLFVVNKMDACDLEEDDLDEVLDGVRRDIRRFGYEHYKICPLSAGAGFLMKRLLAGEGLTEAEARECEEYVRIFLQEGFDLSRFYPGSLPDASRKKRSSRAGIGPYRPDQVAGAYRHTGLPSFEQIIHGG